MLERKPLNSIDRTVRKISFDRYSRFKTLLWFYKTMLF